MKLIDVHAHYYLNESHSIEILEKEATEYGFIIQNGLDIISNKIVIEESRQSKILKAALGFHPTNINSIEDKKLAIKETENIQNLTKTEEIIAIGEIGLDFYHQKDKEIQEMQKEVFIRYLKLAEKLKLPVIIHARNAGKEVIEILENLITKKKFKQDIVLHCFESSEKLIKKAIQLKCFFSIPPAVIRNEQFQKTVNLVDTSKLLTETDAPYQAPDKTQKNRPNFVNETINYIAKIKKLDKLEVKNIILGNYLKIF